MYTSLFPLSLVCTSCLKLISGHAALVTQNCTRTFDADIGGRRCSLVCPRGVLQFKLMLFGLSVHAQRQAYVLCHSNPLVQIERDARWNGVSSCDECVLCLLHALPSDIYLRWRANVNYVLRAWMRKMSKQKLQNCIIAWFLKRDSPLKN